MAQMQRIVFSTTHQRRISKEPYFFGVVRHLAQFAAKELSLISSALSPHILIWLVSAPSADLPARLRLKP